MDKQTWEFAFVTDGGIIIKIGRSTIEQPVTDYKGAGIKWYPEERKEKK